MKIIRKCGGLFKEKKAPHQQHLNV